MSRTRDAFFSKDSASSSGRPKSLTSMAPDTLNRSFMTMFISALRLYPSWVMAPSLRPTMRAGIKKMGKRTRAIRVICQLRMNMKTSTMTTVTRLPTTLDSRSVKACWAPMTSLLSRLTRAPVWVRVKKASGIRWMWRNTLDRMS